MQVQSKVSGNMVFKNILKDIVNIFFIFMCMFYVNFKFFYINVLVNVLYKYFVF